MIGGALKLVDPSGSVGALRALGAPVGPGFVRVVAAAEFVLGLLALTMTSAVVAVLVALSYAGFLAVTVVALIRRLPIDSCGCLGRLETPPSWRHLVVLGVAFVGAAGATIDPDASLLERLTDDGGSGIVLTLIVLAATAVGVVVMRMGRR